MPLAWIDPPGTVRDVAPGNPSELYHPDVAAFYTVTVPDGTKNGATLEAGAWVNPPPPPEPVPQPPPPPPVPQEITLRQLLFALRNQGWITQAEAIAAAKNGDMPSTLSDLLASVQQAGGLTQGQVDDAALTWAAMYQAVRNDELWDLFTATGAATTAQIDAVFVEGATL